MKNAKTFQLKIVIFKSREKSLHVAWACFRNGCTFVICICIKQVLDSLLVAGQFLTQEE